MSLEHPQCYDDPGPTPDICRYRRWPYCFCPPSEAWEVWMLATLERAPPAPPFKDRDQIP